jgi:hypothetical protein
MSGHGGKRPGARRPSILSRFEELTIGAECEHRWRNLGSDLAKARREKRPDIEKIRAIQGRTDLVPLHLRRFKSKNKIKEETGDDIDDALRHAKRKRLDSIIAKRPRGHRDQVIADVIAWWSHEQRAQGISKARCVALKPWLIEKCWKLFRRTQRRFKT